MRTRWLLLLVLSALVVNGAASASPKRVSLPRFVRLSLAGKRLDLNNTRLTLRDKKSGYYLNADHYRKTVSESGGSTRSMILQLCPDTDELENGGAGARVQYVNLPRLRTGTGVNIGDTPRQVERKLGAPLNVYDYGGGRKIRLYLYSSWVPVKLIGGDSDSKWLYNARYTFHDGRLWAIRYTLDEPDTGEH